MFFLQSICVYFSAMAQRNGYYGVLSYYLGALPQSHASAN
jgi:hypothetical protein